MNIYKIVLFGDDILFQVTDKKNEEAILSSLLRAKNSDELNELILTYEEGSINIIEPIFLKSIEDYSDLKLERT